MKRTFLKKKNLNTDMVLQITSMADIFTILLVFLLKSFASGTSAITPASQVTLPETNQANPITSESVKLEISSRSILLDEKLVLPLSQFQLNPQDLAQDGTPRPLNHQLANQRNKVSAFKYPQLLILADQNTPYGTLKRVLASASNSGFVDYKLVVVVNE
jgi:biopolymer transport protein ExbD